MTIGQHTMFPASVLFASRFYSPHRFSLWYAKWTLLIHLVKGFHWYYANKGICLKYSNLTLAFRGLWVFYDLWQQLCSNKRLFCLRQKCVLNHHSIHFLEYFLKSIFKPKDSRVQVGFFVLGFFLSFYSLLAG